MITTIYATGKARLIFNDWTDPAKRDISPSWHEVRFTGGLGIKDGVGLYREVDPKQIAYVGTPSSEIDAAWNDLIYRIHLPFATPSTQTGLNMLDSFELIRCR